MNTYENKVAELCEHVRQDQFLLVPYCFHKNVCFQTKNKGRGVDLAAERKKVVCSWHNSETSYWTALKEKSTVSNKFVFCCPNSKLIENSKQL